MMSLKLTERPAETKQKKPSERITKAKRLRTLARGYKVLKKDKATAYQAAAEALDYLSSGPNRVHRASSSGNELLNPWCANAHMPHWAVNRVARRDAR